ncbi:ABC transporter permease [Uliginosibacterium sp. H1]|uniref:ABC transporter permease n=1 Tax=Uliginosibacterium sp. H1 TaxID=3114757 RepID=UPI002E193DD9|nr:ABC transporter permease [Uliginosibacterium sp. H1]
MQSTFSLSRLLGVMLKEFIQLKRDRLTFAMMIGIPIIQMALFGFAINGDPKYLPTVIVAHEQGTYTRSLVRALENSDYFRVVASDVTDAQADRMLAQGQAQFALTIPAGFARALERGERPALLLEADATDPGATGPALGAVQQLATTALAHDLKGPLAALQPGAPAFEWRIQKRYNPDGITQYNIVPGLMGVILTMTLIMMTGLGITREVERGTMENLLATPVRPLEVMVGKIAPYIIIGYVQVLVILLAARYVFDVPFAGSFTLLMLCVLVFIAANLTVGITMSSMARNQTQAMQMTFFFFLPSILLSGFMFPFRGMPDWAQWIGEVLPLTHFLRLIRGVMLKGNGLPDLWPEIWPLLLFMLAVMLVGLKRFRRTLD